MTPMEAFESTMRDQEEALRAAMTALGAYEPEPLAVPLEALARLDDACSMHTIGSLPTCARRV